MAALRRTAFPFVYGQTIAIVLSLEMVYYGRRYNGNCGGARMNFEIKKTRQKEERIYKTIYIKEDLWKTIDAIAAENHTSFNNVVVSILEACLMDREA